MALFPAGFPGDLSLDGQITATDIDEAYRLRGDGGPPPIPSAEPEPVPDGVIENDDIEFLIRDILATEFGDANLDGSVGNADFGTVLGNFGATDVGWAGGDLNGDGVVGNADFGLVLGNFGFAVSSGSLHASAGELAAVPEPSTFWLALVGLCAACRTRSRD